MSGLSVIAVVFKDLCMVKMFHAIEVSRAVPANFIIFRKTEH